MKPETKSPIVTVSMATHNSAATIERAVTSILSQEFSDFELLIFDAHSTDDTRTILKELASDNAKIRVHYHNKRTPWVVSAKMGLQLAAGKYFVFLDGDDFVAPDYLSKLVMRHRAESLLGVMARLLHCDTDGRLRPDHPAFCREFKFAGSDSRRARIHRMIMMPDRYGAVNLLYALWVTSDLREIGLWSSENERRDDDFLFCLRALSRGKVVSEQSTWICRSIEPGLGPTNGSEMLTSQFVSVARISKRFGFSDWTFPYFLQVIRFVKTDWRNAPALFPLGVRFGMAIVALPIRLFQKIRATQVAEWPNVSQ